MAEMHRATRGRRGKAFRWAAGLALVSSLILIAAAPAAATDWFTMTLRNHTGTTLQDADATGQRAAVVWREAGDVWIRGQNSADAGFGPRSLVATDARQAEVEACGSSFRAIYAKNYGGTWLVNLTHGPLSNTASAASTGVSPGDSQTRDPDVACTSNRVVASWLVKHGTEWQVTISDARNTDMNFGTATIVAGPMDPSDGQPVIAGAGNYAYLAYPIAVGAAHRIVVWSYVYGSGPDYDRSVTHVRTLTSSGRAPQIAALGSKVAVVWTDECGALKGRVSNDRGNTWAPVRTVVAHVCAEDLPSLLAEKVLVRPGDNAVLVGYSKLLGGFKTAPETVHRMVVTPDDFVSKINEPLLHQDGYGLFKLAVYGVGGDLIAGAADVGNKIQFMVQSEPA